MERLSDNAVDILNDLHTERLEYASEYIPLIDAANRLAAYEDTGLEPEEIYQFRNLTKMIPLDRLRELAQADKERSKGCPCCSGMTFLSGYFCGSGREKDGHVIHVYTQDIENFNFCPMCGRSLKEEWQWLNT